MIRLALVLALAAVVLVVAGVALWSIPAALIASGVAFGAASLYVLAWAERRRTP